MLTLRTTQFMPPGGAWFYEIDGRRFESRASFVELERSVVDYLERKGEAVPVDLRARLHDYMCKRLPAGNCTGDGVRIPGSVSPGYFEILKNLSKIRGRAYVDARRAEDRAQVCRACQQNNFGACHSCNGLKEEALRAVGGRRVLNLPYLGVCVIYGVPTYGLVWVSGLEEAGGLPETCWMKGALR